MLRGRTRQRPVVARIAPPIATFAQRGPGGTPGIAIDFIEVEHAAVLRATRAGAEHRQCLAALDEADLAAFVSSLGIAATRIDQTYDSLVHAAQV
jgi:hypothetical protein